MKWLPPAKTKGKQLVSSTIIIILIAAACFSFSNLIPYRIVAFILLVTVSLLAVVYDIVPVLWSATLSAFIWNFFFIPPLFNMDVHETEDTILLIMYFIIAMINGILTFKIRQLEKETRLKEEKANSVKLYNTILNSLSHELRTPIATIIGATDNLQINKNLSPSDKEELIHEISKATLRLNRQVENLLNISRLESGHIKPKNDWCDIEELIYKTVKRVEEDNYPSNIRISASTHLPLCMLDEGMLDQVLYNLLNNAVVHNEPGTQVEIIASCHADLLELIIEDRGKGFMDMDINDALDKFSRHRIRETSGSGLGLSIVKGFTEALNGNVQLVKTEPGGAKFIITLPVKTSFINSES